MAIDTAAKRRSISGVPFFPLSPGVTPSVAKAATWRQQSGWSYSGIALAAPIVAFLTGFVSVTAKFSSRVAAIATLSGYPSSVSQLAGRILVNDDE